MALTSIEKVKGIAECKINRHGFDISLDLYDGKTFPCTDHSFDKVFSSPVFHQLDKETKLSSLKEILGMLKPNGQILIEDSGQAKSKRMRLAFYLVQMLDGFKTTNDNVRGFLPEFMAQVDFKNVRETDFLKTNLGTYSYYLGRK